MTDPAPQETTLASALLSPLLIGAQILLFAGLVALEIAIDALELPETLPPEQRPAFLGGLFSGFQLFGIVFLAVLLMGQGAGIIKNRLRRNRSVEAEHD